MEFYVTPILMGDPSATYRRQPTADEMARLENGRVLRGYDFWTEEDEAALRRLHARDWTFEAIARVLGRDRNECGRKAQHMGLPSRDARKVGFKGWRRRRVA